jgi:hypothetical protein
MQSGWMGANFRACLKRMIKRQINHFLRVLLKEFARSLCRKMQAGIGSDGCLKCAGKGRGPYFEL